MNDMQGLDTLDAGHHEAITPPPPSTIEDTLKMIHGQVTWLTQELDSVKTQNAHLQEELEAVRRDFSRTLSTSAGKDEAKSADPPEFHGDQKELEGWIMACRLRFATQPSKFLSEDKKTLHATSFLRGPPRSWIQPLANAYLLGQGEPPAEFLDFEMFVKSLKALYGDPNLERNSMSALAILKQNNSVAEYISRFATHSQHTKLNDVGLAKYFYDGLKGTIKAELVTKEWTTLQELQTLATRLDARLQERRVEREREGSSAKLKSRNSVGFGGIRWNSVEFEEFFTPSLALP